MIVKTAQFLGVLNIPLSYNCRVNRSVGDSDVLTGAFSQTSASNPCFIYHYWNFQTGQTQYVNVTRYNAKTVDLPTNYITGVATGASWSGPATRWGALLNGAYLYSWAGGVNTPPGVKAGTLYCGPGFNKSEGMQLQRQITGPQGQLFNFLDTTVNGVMECSFFGLRFSMRVLTNLAIDNNALDPEFGFHIPPYMWAWNPTSPILVGQTPIFNTPQYQDTFFGNDPQGHRPNVAVASEQILGNVPDYATGMNYTLYADSASAFTQANTHYYISAWNWAEIAGPALVLEKLYSQIAFSDPNFPAANLQYQSVHSVTGGFVFVFPTGSSYVFQGVSYRAIFLSADGSFYYLLNAQWLFNASDIVGGNTTVLNNMNTNGYARDGNGNWFASVLSNTNAFHFVGTSFQHSVYPLDLYNPGNIITKRLDCFNPCNAFPMKGN